MNGTALNLEQIHGVPGERFERSEERARAVSETHGEGNLARAGRKPRGRFVFRNQEDKAREIFGIVLDAFGENHTLIMLGCASPGDRRAGFVSARQDFTNAAGGIFGGNASPLRVSGEKTLALRQRHGMGGDGTYIGERYTRSCNKVHFNWQNRLRDNRQPAFHQ